MKIQSHINVRCSWSADTSSAPSFCFSLQLQFVRCLHMCSSVMFFFPFFGNMKPKCHTCNASNYRQIPSKSIYISEEPSIDPNMWHIQWVLCVCKYYFARYFHRIILPHTLLFRKSTIQKLPRYWITHTEIWFSLFLSIQSTQSPETIAEHSNVFVCVVEYIIDIQWVDYNSHYDCFPR